MLVLYYEHIDLGMLVLYSPTKFLEVSGLYVSFILRTH